VFLGHRVRGVTEGLGDDVTGDSGFGGETGVSAAETVWIYFSDSGAPAKPMRLPTEPVAITGE